MVSQPSWLSPSPTTSGACETQCSITLSRIPDILSTSNASRATGLRSLADLRSTRNHVAGTRRWPRSMRGRVRMPNSEIVSSSASCRRQMTPAFVTMRSSAAASVRTWSGPCRCACVRAARFGRAGGHVGAAMVLGRPRDDSRRPRPSSRSLEPVTWTRGHREHLVPGARPGSRFGVVQHPDRGDERLPHRDRAAVALTNPNKWDTSEFSVCQA